MGLWVDAFVDSNARTHQRANPSTVLTMQERRRYLRVETPVLVEFPGPGTMKTERSYTQDVSETGMRFPTTVRLSVGQELPITLQLPFQGAPFHTTGEVVWVREMSRLGAPQYDVGLRFRWIEDPDRQRLARHLASIGPRR